jgi:hypothetical protein
MSDVDTLKGEIKKLSARATTAKMNLHDLSEELPINWTSIMTVAAEARDAYAGGGARETQGDGLREA